ncbi:cytochrome c biogenesis protein CcsA [Roseibacillus ishigakijimensis]|uniref:Cytochrome c biogenesis protein CcsA n=1 Tax=Roseibacillus ishigakijimensis TaxID=454146 RepID=A0A934RS70_9BACT|nr:cytochrome c biogenesis protein CcsA [Roseibacillus ishigakijimensis]MBK1834957.1 cytochrome c biogenesis protein CcsA [Roseibacillus ishigakijimensis]
MIERWLLALATAFAAFAAVNAWRALLHGHRSHWTLPLLGLTFVIQLMALGIRGEMRGACPLSDPGEILAFLSWSLVLFYLLVGPAYRLSLLGLFTAPVVVLLHLIALLPGMMSLQPERVLGTDPWRETHAALSVLSFGSLTLSAVSGCMFLILDKLLKDKKLSGNLFNNLPSVHNLIDSTKRLLLVGVLILTVGIVAGFATPGLGFNKHLIIASVVWLAYLVLVALAYFRGLPPHRLALSSVVFFLLSLPAFGLI